MGNDYGFWTDKNVYFKKKNIFTVEFDFIPPLWVWEPGATHWINGFKNKPEVDKATSDHPELNKEQYTNMVNMITRVNGQSIVAKSIDLPSFAIAPEGDAKKRNTITTNGTVEVAPGLLDWNPINITLTDVVFGQDLKRFSPISAIQAALYFAIGSSNSQTGATATDPILQQLVLGTITINMLDAEGHTLDQWSLSRCWITAMDYGTLSYEDDTVNELTLTIDYINAKYTTYAMIKDEKTGEIKHQENWSVRK